MGWSTAPGVVTRWAGAHKLLSTGWYGGGATFIATSLGRPELRDFVAVVLPLCELGLGLTALWPRLWKVTALGAVLVHGGILVTLSPLFGDWNSAVWPWNAAVAVVAPMLCLSQPKGAAFPSPAIVAVAAVLLAFPALFYRSRRRLCQPQPVFEQHRHPCARWLRQRPARRGSARSWCRVRVGRRRP